jgi:hypothetical protein
MGQKDVVDLYDRIGSGAEVQVIRGALGETEAGQSYASHLSRL